MSYLGVLLLLSLLVMIHEAGHLLAAKGVGIPVAGFSVGLGPKIWSRRWGRTEYVLRALPLGGFVTPAVADDEEFRAIPLWRRLVFFLGGPAGQPGGRAAALRHPECRAAAVSRRRAC